MKVILLKDVRNVGQHDEVKDVADGYARNFLLPKKLACAATLEKIREIEVGRAQKEAELKKEEEALAHAVDALQGKRVTISARNTENGRLFKSITPADVVKAILAGHALEVPETAVIFHEPVKTLGEHPFTLRSKSQKAELELLVEPAQ